MEKETVKLLNVLRRIARAAGYAAWTKAGPDATQFCVAQYNRVLNRLSELEPAIKPLFTPLSESSSPEVTRIAARELLAYFEVDEPEFVPPFGRGFVFRGGRPRHKRGRCVPLYVGCK
ncbi:MAG TPA: hypothetical protein VGW58_10415 [Pyrinomonadaceae bacterium]|nr:hypothetical protein [Pyrinomonadaceae bacterium]